MLVQKGVLSRVEIDGALERAELTAVNDYPMEDLSPANRDAVAFAARLLRLPNNGASEAEVRPFSELAKMVGQTKEHYNDQR